MRRGQVWDAFQGRAQSLADDWDVGCEKENGLKDDSQVLARATGCTWFHLLY